jgi:hypothetical protein
MEYLISQFLANHQPSISDNTNLIKLFFDKKLYALAVMLGTMISCKDFPYDGMYSFLYYYSMSLFNVKEYKLCYQLLGGIMNKYLLDTTHLTPLFEYRDLCSFYMSKYCNFPPGPYSVIKGSHTSSHTPVFIHDSRFWSIENLRETLNSFLNCCLDNNSGRISRWYLLYIPLSLYTDSDTYIVNNLHKDYPFLEIICYKGEDECYEFISNVKTPFLILVYSGWKFITEKPYISYIGSVFEGDKKCCICMFNRNFIYNVEIQESSRGVRYFTDIRGVEMDCTYNYVIHRDGTNIFYNSTTSTNSITEIQCLTHPCIINMSIMKLYSPRLNDPNVMSLLCNSGFCIYQLMDINIYRSTTTKKKKNLI